MKNISNSDPYPDILNLKGLNVEGSISAGNIVSDSLIATTSTIDTIDSTTLNTLTLNSTFINTSTVDASSISAIGISLPAVGNILFGFSPFNYARGNWTPVFQTYRGFRTGTLVKENWNGQYNTQTNGYYTKAGTEVRIWFFVTCQFNGFQNDLLYAPRFPIITNLPYDCINTVGGFDLTYAEPTSKSQFPNNYAGPVPAPLATTFEGVYRTELLESGLLFTPQIPPLYDPSGLDTIVSDGKTLTITCLQSQRIPLVAEWAKDGTVNNGPVLATGSGYTASFAGTMTYYTSQ